MAPPVVMALIVVVALSIMVTVLMLRFGCLLRRAATEFEKAPLPTFSHGAWVMSASRSR